MAEWKTQKGFKSKIVRLSEIGSDSTQIRSYIINAYNTWPVQPEYLLIVGNKYQVPFPLFYHASNVVSYSDNYYANVTGDFHNELYHGRFWVSDTFELKTVVAKVLGYEKNPYMIDSLWFKKGVTIVNENEQGQPSSAELYWADARYAHQFMFNAGYQQIDSFSYYLGNDSIDVINAINDGRTYILYRGIGAVDWLWPFGGIYASQMHNGFKLPVVLSGTCATIEGIGNDWLTAGTPTELKGVIGFFGTTTSLFSAAEMRSALCRATTLNLFTDSTSTLGKAAEAGRLEYYAQFQDLIDYHSWSCLGDPELTMWTAVPRELLVGHNMYFSTGICTANVYVQHNFMPVENALVCVMARADSTFYHYGYTDYDGHVQFIDTLHIPGDSVYVTVTGRNLRTYQNALPVHYIGGPYVRLYSYRVLDSLGGNCDYIANPGEDIEIPFCLRNWGDATAHGVSATIEKIYPDTTYTLYDTIKYIGDIAPLGSVYIYPDGYNVIVDSGCPDLQEVALCLQINDAGSQTWTSDLGFTVHAPLIHYHDYSFTGDVKYTLPGATDELFVELTNTGSYQAENVTGRIFCTDTLLTIIDSTTTFSTIPPESIGSNENDPFIVTSSSSSPPCHPADIMLEIVSGVYVDTFNFNVYIGQKDYLVWDPDPDQSSGPVIRELLDSLEFNGDYRTTFPHTFLSLYKSIFVCAGIFPNNYIIRDTSRAGYDIDFYIQNQDGKAYIEGGDVWYDPLANHGYYFNPLFGIDCQYNSIGLFPGVIGVNNTFTQNMAFDYGGAMTIIDYIDTTGGSQLVFKNAHGNNYGCGVAAGNRTVGFSFELGGLVDTLAPSTKLALIDSIMDYFGIPPTGITGSQQSSVTTKIVLSCYPNPFKQITTIRYMINDPGSTIEDVSLCIYDVTGRLVKSFHPESSIMNHESRLLWDGTDEVGRAVAHGIYFIYLQTGESQTVAKTILLQ